MTRSFQLLMEGAFILSFGILHLIVPFLVPSQTASSIQIFFFSLELRGLVTFGSIVIALLSTVFVIMKNIYSGKILIFMYLSGTAFHIFYFLGIFPPLVTVPADSPVAFFKITTNMLPAIGIFMDTFVSMGIYDYYHRLR